MKKKFITVGAATLTALTLLGTAQPLAHAAEVHQSSHQNAVKLDQKVSAGDFAVKMKGETTGCVLATIDNGLVWSGTQADFTKYYQVEVIKNGGTTVTLTANTKGDLVNDKGDIVELETGDTFKITFGENSTFEADTIGTNPKYTGEKSFSTGKTYAFTVRDDGSVNGIDEKAAIDAATSAVNGLFKDGAAATQLGAKTYRADIKSALDKVLVLPDSEAAKAPLQDKIGTAWDLHAPLQSIDSTKKIFTATTGKASDYIGNVFTDSTHTKLKSGYVAAITGLSKVVSEQYINASGYTTIDWNNQGTFTSFLNDLAQAKTLADVPETAAQDLVDGLFKDTTYAELSTGVTVQKIETARKAVTALNDSSEKTEMLNQIGDAYGMYFILDAKDMQAGDPLGDKVKADTNMKTLHDFVEAATDYEADMVKAKTSNSSAGIYDHVRSGWSKAIATAVSRVNSYVPGTDWSQAGLGDFSTDVANLNTAASAIQADQNDVNNDKVEVKYNYTVPAPGEPGWYGVVPSAVTLTDANRNAGQLANVELKDATQVAGKYVPYDGGKTVEVSVKSDNSYKLDDGKNDPMVDYKLDFVDGQGTHDVVQDNSEHKIGEMKAGNTTIVSHISLVGNATKSGKYVDNLFYHFSEK